MARRGAAGKFSHGGARHGLAGQGVAGRGKARLGRAGKFSRFHRGEAVHGPAGRGGARQGVARQGRGVFIFHTATPGTAGPGGAVRGTARRGRAWQCRARRGRGFSASQTLRGWRLWGKIDPSWLHKTAPGPGADRAAWQCCVIRRPIARCLSRLVAWQSSSRLVTANPGESCGARATC